VELEASDIDAAAAGSVYASVVREGFDDVFSRLDLGPAIAAALMKVPEPFRATLIIVDVEDQSYESAAELLGVPIGTVRSRLFRGRRLMQEQLLTYAIDAGFGVGNRASVGPRRDDGSASRTNTARMPRGASAPMGLSGRLADSRNDGSTAVAPC
jgi:RNA polymerase sigma-70 factor (ECF subfamily)